MFGQRALIVGAGAAVLVGHIACATEFKPVQGQEYQEFYNPPTPVSGISVVGAMLLTGAVPAIADELWVYFKQPFNGQLDLEIVSADGRFLGRGAFEGSSKGSEWIELSLAPEGRRTSRPADPKQETVAVSAQSGNRDIVLIAAWGAQPDELARSSVRLYVNSRGAPMNIRVDPDPKVQPIGCHRLAGTKTVRFDTVCTFPATQLSEDGKVTLIRRDGLRTESQTVILGL